MKHVYSLIFFLVAIGSWANPAPSIQFVQNIGQWDSSILYKAEINGGYLLVKKSGIQYVFIDKQPLIDAHTGKQNLNNAKLATSLQGHAFEMTFQDSNPLLHIESAKKLPTFHNYYIGNDEKNWRTKVPVFEEVYFKEVYDGIDFRLYSLDQNLKYEYIVKPKANPSKISMKYEGLDEIKVDNQQIHYRTSLNFVKEFQPYTYQTANGKSIEIGSKFRVKNNEVSFEISDKYDSSKPLVIDPELVFSTFSGSRADNWAQTATYDSEGNLYAGGVVFGSDFPVTNGAFQTKTGGVGSIGITDVVIMKFSSDGKSLLYSTFIGGNISEVPHSLVVNSKDELVIFGTTSSRNFPTTNSAFQRIFGGGIQAIDDPITTQIAMIEGTDIFVSVLSKDGSQLLGSTYVGGSGNDGINDTRQIAIRNYGDEFRGEVFTDKNDNIFFTATTNSNNFPLENAFQNIKGASLDAVVCQLNANCSKLIWSTYFGGNGFDNGTGIRVTPTNEVFICGTTSSSNLASKSGSLNQKLLGKSDGYVAKFVNDDLVQVTYLGTSDSDVASLIDIDKAGDIYVLGLSLGAYQVVGSVYKNANSGQFIHSLDKNLSKTNFSTTIGTGRTGKFDIVPTAFMVSDCGNIYLSGWGGKVNVSTAYRTLTGNTTTTGLPITADAIQKNTTGNNFYLMILESGAKSLVYGTFFGGNPADFATPDGERGDHVDGGTCRFDKNGVIYHSACSCKGSTVSFPLKNSFSTTHNSSNCNMAAFKIDLGTLKANFDIQNGITLNPTTEICGPTDLNFNNKSIGATQYEWFLNDKPITNLKNYGATFQVAGQYVMKLKAYNTGNCKAVDSLERKFTIKTFESTISKDTTVCGNTLVQLNATGGVKYSWSPASALNNATISNPIAKVNTTTKFSVTIENAVCTVNRSVTIKVDDAKTDFVVTSNQEICKGQTALLTATGKGIKTVWTRPNLPDTTAISIRVKPSKTTTYTVKSEYADGCQPKKDVTVSIDESYQPDFDYKLVQECGKPYQLIFNNLTKNASTYVWLMGNGDSLKTEVPQNYRYLTKGKYPIHLKAYNKIGCMLEMTKIIDIPEADGDIPNVITPNNDGKNDTFVVGYFGAIIKIYNRYGKLIFEANDYQNDWGKGIVADTYFYTLKTPEGSECKGLVTVIN